MQPLKRACVTGYPRSNDDFVTIGVDVDGVLCEQLPMLDVLNEICGLQLIKSDWIHYSMNGHHGVTEDEWKYAVKYYQKHLLPEVKMIPGADTEMRRLFKIARIHIVTSRPTTAYADTIWWLRKHGIPVDAVSMDQKEKHKFKDFDLMIEDCAEQAINICKSGRPAILLDQPWNRHEVLEGPSPVRVYSWRGIVEVVESWLGV